MSLVRCQSAGHFAGLSDLAAHPVLMISLYGVLHVEPLCILMAVQYVWPFYF
jgi:hypothetical protein